MRRFQLDADDSTTSQYPSVITNHTVEETTGEWAEAQAATKVHHSNNSSGPGHGNNPSRLHPRKNEPVAHRGQPEDPRSTGESTVEDLVVVAQPQLEDVE